VLAAQRGTSLSGLVAAEINRLAAQKERYERAMLAALARLAEVPEAPAGDPPPLAEGRGWTREEIYAERTDRWPRP
jgi:hypothetical protein